MISEEMLYTGTITDIAGLIRDCKFPEAAFVLVERMPRSIIDDRRERLDLLRLARLSDGIDIAPYTSGRVFHGDFELRWEQDAVADGKTSVVYIGLPRNLPGLTTGVYTLLPEEETRAGKEDESQYYLFGEQLDGEKLARMALPPERGSVYYAETRVPRLLLYPEIRKPNGALPERLQVITRRYRVMVADPDKPEKRESGRAYRFVDLVAAREEK